MSNEDLEKYLAVKLQRQLGYPRDDTPVAMEPDASQVWKGKGEIHQIRKSSRMESFGSAASLTSTKMSYDWVLICKRIIII